MCADDVVCAGAEPLAFLDYIAVGRLDPRQVAELVGGVADGCRQAGCALVGGETAEHPGLMEAGEFDLAGFCIGVGRARARCSTGRRPGRATRSWASPSSGLHANGFSLVRALVAQHDLDLRAPYQALLRRMLGRRRGRSGCSQHEPRSCARDAGRGPAHADAHLRPATSSRSARRSLRAGHDVRGIAHITGGGLPGNVPRALPRRVSAHASTPRSWPMPSVMRLLGALGGIEDDELRATFNGGLGMVVVVPAAAAERDGRAGRTSAASRLGRRRGRRRGELGGHRYAEGAVTR